MKGIVIAASAVASLVLPNAAGELASTTKNAIDTNATSPSLEATASVETMCAGTAVGVDLPGNDLYSVRSSQPNPCWSYCYTNDNCKAWTWTDFNGGTCWLKSGRGNAVFRAGAFSGAVYECSSPARYLVVENCDARGNDVSNNPGRNYWDCMGVDTGSFTWSDYGGGTCWYKSAVSGCEYASNKFTGILL